MLKPLSPQEPSLDNRKRPQRRRLRTIAMFPTLLTLGNLYFGFAIAYYCGREMQELGAGRAASEVQTLKSPFFEARAPSFLSIAGWMFIGALICDALDGRVARRTGQSSKFGAQLDSLADVVSFGLAPAVMMVTLIQREMVEWGHPPLGFGEFGRLAVFIGGIYVCCTGLRLARFTVEATAEEASHEGFRGLPSPGAASAVASLVFLHDHLQAAGADHWSAVANGMAAVLPLCTLLVALLMVSRIRYRHAVSWLLRRRPFSHVIIALLIVPLLFRYTEQVLAVVAWGFVISGPIRHVWRKLKTSPAPPASGAGDNDEREHPAARQQA